MRKNKRFIFVFLLGLIIVVYPHIAQYINSEIQKSQVHQFKNETKALPSEKIIEEVATAKKCNEAIYRKAAGLRDPFTEGYNHEDLEACSKLEFDKKTHFASIEIPKLNLEIPIFLGASEKELSQGIGRVEGSSLPIGGVSTHTVLAGHRGMGTKAMFRNINDLRQGDVFYIYTLEEKLHYQVYDISVILPHETESLQISEGRDLATLVTCHPYRANSHRLLVYGERIK